MNDFIYYAKIIEEFKEDMRGVFTLSDLKAIFSCKYQNSFYRILKRLEKSGILKRFKRGIYVTNEFDLTALSQKIEPSSYISFESVLAKNLILGTVPKYEIKAVKVGKKREYKSDQANIIHYGVVRHLYFGFSTNEGINFADKEKALLDTLYFYSKGMKLYFDIYSDIDLTKVDISNFKKYLLKYKNPKFIKFVKEYIKSEVL